MTDTGSCHTTHVQKQVDSKTNGFPRLHILGTSRPQHPPKTTTTTTSKQLPTFNFHALRHSGHTVDTCQWAYSSHACVSDPLSQRFPAPSNSGQASTIQYWARADTGSSFSSSAPVLTIGLGGIWLWNRLERLTCDVGAEVDLGGGPSPSSAIRDMYCTQQTQTCTAHSKHWNM